MFADWRFCPRCSAAIRPTDEIAECGECGFVVYANPAPTASALLVDERGRLLLARRAKPPFEGLWDLPGGFLDEHEHPLDAVRRELLEETGLDIEPERFLGIWMDRYSDDDAGPGTMNLYWTARVVGGTEKADDDVSELAWFEPDALPETLAFRNVALVLAEWRQQQR